MSIAQRITGTGTKLKRLKWARFAGITLVVLVFLGTLIDARSVTRAQAGDWPTYLGNNAHTGFDAAETIINPSTVHNLKIHWRQKHSVKISTQPILANNLLYWRPWKTAGPSPATGRPNCSLTACTTCRRW